MMLSEIISDPEKLKECHLSARNIREKRRLKMLNTNSRSFKVSKYESSYVNLTMYDKHKKVTKMKAQLENDDMKKKFLMMHKRDILKRYVL